MVLFLCCVYYVFCGGGRGFHCFLYLPLNLEQYVINVMICFFHSMQCPVIVGWSFDSVSPLCGFLSSWQWWAQDTSGTGQRSVCGVFFFNSIRF